MAEMVSADHLMVEVSAEAVADLVAVVSVAAEVAVE